MSIKIGDRVRLVGAFLEVSDPQDYPLGTVIDIICDEPFPPLRVEWDDSPATPGLHHAKELEVMVRVPDYLVGECINGPTGAIGTIEANNLLRVNYELPNGGHIIVIMKPAEADRCPPLVNPAYL